MKVGNMQFTTASVVQYGSRGFGFVVKGNDRAFFHIASGRKLKIAMGGTIVLGDPIDIEPRRGDKLCVSVSEVSEGFRVDSWFYHQDYLDALDTVRTAQFGKRAPAVPPIPRATNASPAVARVGVGDNVIKFIKPADPVSELSQAMDDAVAK